MSMTLPLGASLEIPTSTPAEAKPASAASPPAAATAPRFSLLGLILLTALVAVLCGAIFAMPFRLGTWVLFVVNLGLAPFAISGIVFGQGYLRAACIGLVLPGLLVWFLAATFFRTVAMSIEQGLPQNSVVSPWTPYSPYMAYPAYPGTAPMNVPAYMPASSAPPDQTSEVVPEPAAPEGTSPDGSPSSPPQMPQLPPNATGGPPSPASVLPLQPVPPPMVPQQIVEYIDPDFYHLRICLIANPLLAALCVACAVGAKWFNDLQPASS